MADRYSKKYKVHYFDLDKNKRIKPTTLFNFLQDISTTHFEDRTQHLNDEELSGIWMIIEWHVKMNALPQAAQEINITTEPTYFRKFLANRKYCIEDESGQCIGEAVSKWAYVDPNTRKQSNLPKILNKIFEVPENAEKPARIEFDQLGEDEATFEDTIMRKSLFSDIDVNQHVNNVAYLRWAIDALDYQMLDQHELLEVRMSFKKEVLQDTAVTLSTKIKETAEHAVSHHIVLDAELNECVYMQMNWQKSNQSFSPFVG